MSKELLQINIISIGEHSISHLIPNENKDQLQCAGESGLFDDFIYFENILVDGDTFPEDRVKDLPNHGYIVSFTPLTDGIEHEIDNMSIKDFLDYGDKGVTDWNDVLDYMVNLAKLYDSVHQQLIVVYDIIYMQDSYSGEWDVDYNYLGVLDMNNLVYIKDDELNNKFETYKKEHNMRLFR